MRTALRGSLLAGNFAASPAVPSAGFISGPSWSFIVIKNNGEHRRAATRHLSPHGRGRADRSGPQNLLYKHDRKPPRSKLSDGNVSATFHEPPPSPPCSVILCNKVYKCPRAMHVFGSRPR